MSSILFAKHVSFEHSVSSPRPVITSRREKTTTTRPKFFSTQSTVSPLHHAPSSAGTCCLHVLSELGRGAASFLATESTGTVLIPRLMTRIAGHDHRGTWGWAGVECMRKNDGCKERAEDFPAKVLAGKQFSNELHVIFSRFSVKFCCDLEKSWCACRAHQEQPLTFRPDPGLTLRKTKAGLRTHVETSRIII